MKMPWIKDENKSCEESNDGLIDNVLERENAEAKVTGFDCFFCKEESSEKWAKKYIKCWYNIMCFMWLIFGSLTFAPIVFIAKKSGEIISNKKVSMLFAILLYAIIAVLIAVLIIK